MVVQQVLQYAHPDFFQSGAFGDLLCAVGICHIEFVLLARLSRPNLGSPDVQIQVLEGANLQAKHPSISL